MTDREWDFYYGRFHEEDTSWRKQAECRDVTDPNVFFPVRGESVNEALAYCRVCPVRSECYDYAMKHPKILGVWGGTSNKQRDRVRWNRRVS